jgi:hypothetical protein
MLPPFAGVAQTAEQLTRNEQAKGSSPFSGSGRRNVMTVRGAVIAPDPVHRAFVPRVARGRC